MLYILLVLQYMRYHKGPALLKATHAVVPSLVIMQ